MGISLLAITHPHLTESDPVPTTLTADLPAPPQPASLPGCARVRPYLASDRDAIRRLCYNTGYLGNPVDPVFKDRELFADLFTKAYLDYEPEWTFVAEADGRVVGYLLGSVCAQFDRFLLLSGFQTVTRMLFRLAMGRYANHPRSRRFIRWLLTAGFWEQPKHPADSAHLHFNLDRSFRGRGMARLLWDTYEERLKQISARRCYGSFFSSPNRQPETVYARYGFRCYDRCRTTLFQPEIPDPVEVVCVCKEL
jgi:GNAT superfamily N-acetyltransferase